MADASPIEWTDATWNPITGCTLVSEGCRNCYAARLAATRLRNHPSRAGLARVTADGTAKFTGEVRFNEQWLTEPLKWTRPRRIFVCAHGDLFHEAVPDAWIDRVFGVMALAPQHTFQVLTKRPERMRDYLTARSGMACGPICRAIDAIPAMLGNRHGALEMPLRNVWLGVSVENQATADARVPVLLDTPATIRFISAEPLLAAIRLNHINGTACLASPQSCCGGSTYVDALRGIQACERAGAFAFPGKHGRPRGLDWVIAGGESGPGARPMLAAWARSLRNQCAAAGVPYLLKQWGEFIDADEWIRVIAGQLMRDGLPWRPAQPLSYADAAVVAKVFGRGDRFEHQSDGTTMIRVGKAASGRTLDGVIHDGFPAAREVAFQ